jgi:hypothetical protein
MAVLSLMSRSLSLGVRAVSVIMSLIAMPPVFPLGPPLLGLCWLDGVLGEFVLPLERAGAVAAVAKVLGGGRVVDTDGKSGRGPGCEAEVGVPFAPVRVGGSGYRVGWLNGGGGRPCAEPGELLFLE